MNEKTVVMSASIMEDRIRQTMVYHDWVKRNKSPTCNMCSAVEKLHLHHIYPLQAIISFWWDWYKDWDLVEEHVIAVHAEDETPVATICETCHLRLHPEMKEIEENREPRLHTKEWLAIPRTMELVFNQAHRTHKPNSIGLVAFQIMLGLGWHVLNDVDHTLPRMLIKRSDFAELIGKKNTGSFNKSLQTALDSLKESYVIDDYGLEYNQLEIIMSRQYLLSMKQQPWFMRIADYTTGRMPVVTLKWFLSMQQDKSRYIIGWEKLGTILGYDLRCHAVVADSIASAVVDIPGVLFSIDDRKRFIFDLPESKVVPIHTLRKQLARSMRGL